MATPGAPATPLTLGGVWFPSGRSLPLETWQRRHRGVIALLWAHAFGLVAFGLYVGADPVHAFAEGGIVVALTLLAAHARFERRFRSIAAAFALMSCSGILTHLSGGYIEAHFHYFVMLGVIFLYEDWLPYVLSVGFVALHHGIVGTLDPLSVYNHPAALARPWLFAGIHALFVFGLSFALIIGWNVIERARISETRALSEAQELKRQLLAQEKMAALGSLVSGLAHELRTPLTAVAVNASLIERSAMRDPEHPLGPRMVAQSREIQAGVDRMNTLVKQLRKFHALTPDELQVVPLDGVVRDAVRLFESANKAARPIALDLQPTASARLDLVGVHQIVLNLITNAVEATDAQTGRIEVRTRSEDESALLVVADNGTGMSDETRSRAFDPLFTTKAEGMGLGLHIVKRIVESHAGSIECESIQGGGTIFTVRFPRVGPGGVATNSPPTPVVAA